MLRFAEVDKPIPATGQALVRPCIDRRYRLADAAEAFRYLQSRQARGKVLVTPS